MLGLNIFPKSKLFGEGLSCLRANSATLPSTTTTVTHTAEQQASQAEKAAVKKFVGKRLQIRNLPSFINIRKLLKKDIKEVCTVR